MMNNAVYITAQDMREIGDALTESTANEGAVKLVKMFDDIAKRYPESSFKVKVILAL